MCNFNTFSYLSYTNAYKNVHAHLIQHVHVPKKSEQLVGDSRENVFQLLKLVKKNRPGVNQIPVM